MIADISQFSALRERMRFLQARQKVLSENVANADTPAYKPKDVVNLGSSALQESVDPSRRLVMAKSGYASALAPAVTNPAHISGGVSGYASQDTKGAQFGTRPSGNSVNLEDEMLKVSQNQIDFQMVTGLYQRSFSTLKIALGRKA